MHQKGEFQSEFPFFLFYRYTYDTFFNMGLAFYLAPV